MSRGGKFQASLQYDGSKNVFLRQIQYRLLDDEEKTLLMAKSIVRGKIQNQLTYMQRIARRKCRDGRIPHLHGRHGLLHAVQQREPVAG